MKKIKVVKSRKIWIIFTFLTFSVMAVSMTLTILCLITAHMNGIINFRLGFSAFIPFSVTSVAVATVLSVFVSRILLSPVQKISDATKKIANGDFSTRISEDSIMQEIALVGKNFNAMMNELEKLEGFRNDFGASVSHEFKTPLSKIKGYAELLRDGTLTEEEKVNCINHIIESVDMLNALSEKMLALARFENQQIIFNKTEFSLDEQLRQAFLVFEERWVKKEIEPVFELEEINYYGDANLIYQIWTNLFDNAIKFTQIGGKIEITLKKEKNKAVVNIFNSGEGIKEKDIHHIFEKFYQGDKSRRDRGSGLGLPLVKRIIELCKGSITVKSELGVGTNFQIILPLEEKTV